MSGAGVPDVSGLLAQIREATAAAQAVVAQQQEEKRALAAEMSESEERRARAARRGELGDDWRVLQQRIDARRTTLVEILSGQDRSPEASRVLDSAVDRLVQMRDDLARSALREGDPDGTGAAFADVERSAAEIRATVARLREQGGSTSGR